MDKGFSFTPEDAIQARSQELLARIPTHVLDVWKSTIINNLQLGRCVVDGGSVAREIANCMNITEEEVRARGYMDAHNIFYAQGWHIQYWKAQKESSSPETYVFDSPPKKRSP